MLPSRRLLFCCLTLFALGLAQHFWAALELLWAGAALALVLLCMIDGWEARKQPQLRIERKTAGVWAVGQWRTVSVTLHNDGNRRLSLTLFDHYPTDWDLEAMPYEGQIDVGCYKTISYRVRPHERGNADFGPSHLRIDSRFGLWVTSHRIGETTSVKIFPDFSQLLGHTLHATDRRAPTTGSIRRRRRGEGTDFRQLREYRQGDSMRAIDWKASARMQKPITREYQEERDQQVVFLLDTGRRMLSQDDSGNHFDHALNAVLTLGFLAQKQGDAIGLLSFGGESRWLSPQKGRTGLDRLLAGTYDLQAEEYAPDYLRAATDLLNRLNKRAFVVLITNLRDEDDQAMRSACELLSTRHLVLCASLREKSLDQALQQRVTQFPEALLQSATALYLAERDTAIKRLGLRASQLIDINPQYLSMALVNRYHDIKESGQL